MNVKLLNQYALCNDKEQLNRIVRLYEDDADALKYVGVLTSYNTHTYTHMCMLCCARVGLDNKLLIYTSAVSQNQYLAVMFLVVKLL